jgi:phage terminase large subunit GpA-like protein
MIELIKHRIESAEGEGKVYLSTTPTTDDADEWQEFLRGDQCKFNVLCPHCGQMQELNWASVWWDPEAKITETEWDYARVKATAAIKCSHCGAIWTEAERLSAIRDPRSTWVPTAQAKIPGTRSFQISGLYGPLQANTPGELAVAFLASRQTGWFASRRDFWNSRMGEPYRDSVVSITAEKFRALMADYERGTLPMDFRADVVIIAVDVQSNRLPWVCMGLSYDGQRRTIDHGDAQTWSDIDRIQREYGRLAPESFVIVDVGFGQRSAETLEAIHMRRPSGWLGARGVEQSAELTKLQKVDPFLGTRQEGAAQIPVLQISTYEFKVEWEKMFTRENDAWRTYTLPPDASEQLVHEQAEYFAQLLDEHRVPRKRILAGKPTWEWRSRSANNHSFDCHVYILALFYFLSRSRTIERVKSEATRPAKRRQYAAS